MDKNIYSKIINCQRLMSEAIKSYNDKGKQSMKLSEIRMYRNQIPENTYKKIENFVNDNIRPMVYDFDYFSFLKDENYGVYDENNNHFIFDNDVALEVMIMKQYQHISDLLDKLNDFVMQELL